MRYCEECGAQLEDDALYCENCGARCQEEEKAAPEPVTEQKEKKNTPAALAVILIVAAVAFAVIVVVSMRGRDGKGSARQQGTVVTEQTEAVETAGLAEATESEEAEPVETTESEGAEPEESTETGTVADTEKQTEAGEPETGTDTAPAGSQTGNASGIPSGLRADDWLEIYEIAGEYLGEYREQYCQLSIYSDGLENSEGADYPEVGVANISVWDYENETQYWFEGLSVKLVGKNIFMAETDAGDIIYFGIYYDPYSDLEGYGMDLYFNGKSQGVWDMIAHYYS